MRTLIIPLMAALCALPACDRFRQSRGEAVLEDIDLSQDDSLNQMMMTVAKPEDAVAHFRKAVEEHPDDIKLQRGLASSLLRAGQIDQSITVYRKVLTMPEAGHDDRIDLAGAFIRNGAWKDAEAELDKVPPTYENYQRYRLEAMIADSNEEWDKADSFYEIAAGLTTRPAGVLNNWGFSHLTRRSFPRAEQLFAQAVRDDPSLFTAKNNLVLARAAQRNYDLPVIQMTQVERAQLLHTAALAAVKQGDITIAKGLLQEAIETHPQHFDAAARALTALEANVAN